MEKFLAVVLWSYLVFSNGVISKPLYWCKDCLDGSPGWGSSIDDADPVLKEEKHVIANQHSIFWAKPIKKWIMIYGGRIPFPTVTDAHGKRFETLLPSLTPDQVFDPEAGIYLRWAKAPQGPWSVPRTIFNPFDARDGKYGYCEIMYFADVYGQLEKHHRARFDQISPECPPDNATRTAQAWWQSLTEQAFPDPEDDRRKRARLNFGAEYGAAVLPKWIRPAPGGGVRFWWLLSTWNPYRVVVMRTDFEP